jgi:hypothetical protein
MLQSATILAKACAFPGRQPEKQRGGNRALLNPRSSNRSKQGARPNHKDEQSVAAQVTTMMVNVPMVNRTAPELFPASLCLKNRLFGMT